MKTKFTSFLVITVLLVSIVAGFYGMSNKVEAATATSLTIVASNTSICANNVITLVATVNGGLNPVASSIIWKTSSSDGTFGTATSTSTTSTITYDDPGAANPIAVTITATYPGDSNNLGSSNTIVIEIYNTIDFFHTGTVNFSDIIYFIGAYITYNENPGPNTYNPVCDLNKSGSLNFNDLLDFIGLYDTYTGST